MAFLAFPLFLIGMTGLLALGLGSFGYFFLFLGQILVVPSLVHLAHLGTSKMDANMVASTDITRLVPTAPSTSSLVNICPSYWMAQVFFFFGYLLENAIRIYTEKGVPNLSAYLRENRTSRAISLIVMSILIPIVIAVLRAYYIKGSETILGIIAAITFMGFGAGWFEFARVCGTRQADIFGIVSQMRNLQNQPRACTYAPSA